MKPIRVFVLEDNLRMMKGILRFLASLRGIEVVHRDTIRGAVEILCPEIIAQGILLCPRSIDIALYQTPLKINAEKFDLIFLDGCVQSNETYNTAVIIHLIKRANFPNPLYAMSSDYDLRERMMEDGCNRQCRKKEIVGIIKTFLKSQNS